MRTLLSIYLFVLNLLLYIRLLIMVLTCHSIQYLIKIASILGICKTNSMIIKTDV